MSTVTSTAVIGWQPKAIHAGVNVAYAKYSTAASLTAASVVQMVKVPDGAIIVDGWAQSPADAFKVNVGDAANPDRYISTAQSSAAVELHRFDEPLGMGYKISVTDAAILKWDTIDILVGSAACTGTLELCVQYYMDKDDNG